MVRYLDKVKSREKWKVKSLMRITKGHSGQGGKKTPRQNPNISKYFGISRRQLSRYQLEISFESE